MMMKVIISVSFLISNRTYIIYNNFIIGHNYIELPKEGLKYLQVSYEEYEVLKKKYVKWYTKNKIEHSNLSKEEFGKVMKVMPVPEVVVRMLIDENELEVPLDNEW